MYPSSSTRVKDILGLSLKQNLLTKIPWSGGHAQSPDPSPDRGLVQSLSPTLSPTGPDSGSGLGQAWA
ncbi:hypothetical protein C8R44DRAFT_818173 [Mycena epipterygia]|nr:hypothetical protein C8R44DRAFT_818173 [Mycena epipterygia]